MNSFLFALNAVLPIILTVALGYFLKKIGLFPYELSKPVNKLIFRVFHVTLKNSGVEKSSLKFSSPTHSEPNIPPFIL